MSKIKLPKFIYKAIAKKYTSLGDNPAFPPVGDFGFEYDVIKDAYADAREELALVTDISPDDIEALENELSRAITSCKRIEERVKPQLEELCANMVNCVLSVPEDTVEFSCSLVNKVTTKRGIRVMPEPSSDDSDLFDDIEDIRHANKEVAKRRLVDALIQGSAQDVEEYAYGEFTDEINSLDERLLPLWEKIRRINCYLTFAKKAYITDNDPMQVSYVEVTLGRNGDKTKIHSQGIVFPYMLKEAFKGYFELFSSHGLPMDSSMAMYIIRKADFVAAEPWDMRFGYALWRKIVSASGMPSKREYPYLFSAICELDVKDFNHLMRNVFANTKLGQRLMSKMREDVMDDYDYQQFANDMRKKQFDKSVISDDCFSPDELDGFVIENID